MATGATLAGKVFSVRFKRLAGDETVCELVTLSLSDCVDCSLESMSRIVDSEISVLLFVDGAVVPGRLFLEVAAGEPFVTSRIN